MAHASIHRLIAGEEFLETQGPHVHPSMEPHARGRLRHFSAKVANVVWPARLHHHDTWKYYQSCSKARVKAAKSLMVCMAY